MCLRESLLGDGMTAQLGDRSREVGLGCVFRGGIAVVHGRYVALDAAQQVVCVLVGLSEATEVEEGEGCDAGTEVGAGGLARVIRLAGEIDDVVDELEGCLLYTSRCV